MRAIKSIESWSGYDRWMTEPPEPSAAERAWEMWDEKPLDEMLTVEQAWNILETLRFGAETAKKELETAINEAFDQYVKDAEEANADAMIDAYLDSQMGYY